MATICHQSDGSAPTKVFSMAPGDPAYHSCMEPSKWDQLMEGCLPQGGGGITNWTGEQEDQVTAVTNALLAAA